MTEKKSTANEKKTEEETKEAKNKNVFEELGDQVGKFATQTVDSIKRTIDKALVSRNTVLTIRVNEDANDKLGMLVETGLFKSRSESAAFLIEEGIKHQDELFKKMQKKMDQIHKLRDDIKTIVSKELDVTQPEKETSK